MDKVLTPKEQIQKLIEEEDALKRRLGEFEKEENVRLMALDAGKESLKRDLLSVDKDLSPQEVVKSSKEIQAKYRILGDDLQAAGSALAAAVEDITKDLRAISAERQGLQKIEHNKLVDLHVQQVWKEFQKWMDSYAVAADLFYNHLLTAIEDGYKLDQRFHERSQVLGLNGSIYEAIDALFRPGAVKYGDGQPKLNMPQVLIQFQEMRMDLLPAEPWPAPSGGSLFAPGENTQFSDL